MPRWEKIAIRKQKESSHEEEDKSPFLSDDCLQNFLHFGIKYVEGGSKNA